MVISDFQFFDFLTSKTLKYIFLKKSIKSTLFRIFKKPDEMLCKLISTIHIPKIRTTHLFFYTQMVPKTDENYRSKFWNVFFGCYKLLTDIKIPSFDSAWKTASDRNPFKLQETNSKFDLSWPHMTWPWPEISWKSC